MGPLGYIVVIAIIVAIVYFVINVCESCDYHYSTSDNIRCGREYADAHLSSGELNPEYIARKMYEETKRLENEKN